MFYYYFSLLIHVDTCIVLFVSVKSKHLFLRRKLLTTNVNENSHSDRTWFQIEFRAANFLRRLAFFPSDFGLREGGGRPERNVVELVADNSGIVNTDLHL